MNDDERERSQANMAQSLKNMKDNWPMLVEIEQRLAALTRVKFLSLVKEGFTESQAMDLCRTWKA